MCKLLTLLLGAVLLSSAAYGQSPVIYLEASQCLNDPGRVGMLQLPGLQFIPIEVKAYAPLGAQAFEFSIPGFTAESGILLMDVVSNPEAASADGNPFAEGARLTFTTCQSSPVKLYTATLLVLGSGASVPWIVAPHSSPSEPGSTCPMASPCGGGSAACVLAGLPRVFDQPPHSPTPADRAINVPLDAALSFAGGPGSCTCLGVACITLYFGVDPDPPLLFSQCDMPFPALDLRPSTTYYWRVRVDMCDGTVIGPVWSFTTTPPIGVEAVTWSNVKKLFR